MVTMLIAILCTELAGFFLWLATALVLFWYVRRNKPHSVQPLGAFGGPTDPSDHTDYTGGASSRVARICRNYNTISHLYTRLLREGSTASRDVLLALQDVVTAGENLEQKLLDGTAAEQLSTMEDLEGAQLSFIDRVLAAARAPRA